MAEFKLESASTSSNYSFACNRCIFCSKHFDEASPSTTADRTKLDKLFEACRIRQDNLGEFILSNAQKITDGEVKLNYHRNCRSTYQSPHHIKRKKSSDPSIHHESHVNVDISSRSRSTAVRFDWQKDCFICGEKCDQKRDKNRPLRSWSLVESVVNADSENMYTKLLKSAEDKNDNVMLERLRNVPNGDLVAVKARYHNKKLCYVKYVQQEKHSSEVTNAGKFKYEAVAEKLKDRIEESLFKEKTVYTLLAIREKFNQAAIDLGFEIPESYKNKYLKILLQTVMPELQFLQRPGLSDLVFSCQITVSDALKTFAKKINNEEKNALNEPVESLFSLRSLDTEESILYNAALILRKQTRETTKQLDNEYFSCNELTLEAQKEFVNPLLYKFVEWLSSENKELEDCSSASDEHKCKCTSLACDLATLITNIASPKHLGLAVHLHNELGSRHIIEDVHNLGHCISYPDLRQFLTSAAAYTTKTQQRTSSGGLIPTNITPRYFEGGLIVGAGDNWDHNERTVDGKRTTHAMTSIILSEKCGVRRNDLRLPKVKERSLDISGFPESSLYRVIPYKKPARRPEPEFDPPVEISEFTASENETVKLAKMKELLYNIGRCADIFCDDISEERKLPPWSIYHYNVSSDNCENVSNVAFNPIIMASPTDYSTIYTTLLRMKETINALGQNDVPVFFDMGLLTKALEIVWTNRNELTGVIPCEGGMHLLMCFFAGIGRLYGDAGLKNLLVESDVYAAGTAEMIMEGKDFDRCLTAYKIVDEVLNRQLLINFCQWCRNNDKDVPDEIKTDLLDFVETIVNRSCTDEDANAMLFQQIESSIVPLLTEFRRYGRKKSPTFRFWDDFLLEILTPLKLFLASSRSGNWNINQYAKTCMLPLLFASNRTTYAKYLAVQVLKMNRLSPDIKNGFESGNFVAKLADGHFNDVWIDYVLEATQNKALKGNGGIIGLTQRGNTLFRWFTARPVTSQYSFSFHNSISGQHLVKAGELKHHTDNKSQLKQFNKRCGMMSAVFTGTFIDPFDIDNHPDNLVNIATGREALPEIQECMLNYLDVGYNSLQKFAKDRLIVSPDEQKPFKSFYDPVSRSKLKTMSDMNKKVTVRSKEVLIHEEVMFQRLLAINAYKKVCPERVFSFENTPVPLSMYSETGEMLSSKKSDFMGKLENLVSDRTTNLKSADCIVFDGMAIIQMLGTPTVPSTFYDVALAFLQYILFKARSVNGVKQVHIVFDRYMENSIKSSTRRKRGDSAGNKSMHIQGNLQIPADWKHFLMSGQQKAKLAAYYTEFIQENACNVLLQDEVIIISGGQGDIAVKVTTDRSYQIDNLESTQEEADTRLILHTAYAADHGAHSIVINSPDTDVLVLLIHHFPKINSTLVYFQTGRMGIHTDMTRFIPVHDIYDKLTIHQNNILLPVYCITGCDTCSAFSGKGKKTAFKLMMNDTHLYQSLENFGASSVITKTQKSECTAFVGAMYGKKECRSFNDLRCEKAKAAIKPRNLPPTENSFHLHCLRCCFQLLIWRNALEPKPDLPLPSEFGFEYDEHERCLKHVLMTQPVAAPELLNDIVCNCDEICTDACTCFSCGQPCTPACCCNGLAGDTDNGICTNIYTMLAAVNSDSDSD